MEPEYSIHLETTIPVACLGPQHLEPANECAKKIFGKSESLRFHARGSEVMVQARYGCAHLQRIFKFNHILMITRLTLIVPRLRSDY